MNNTQFQIERLFRLLEGIGKALNRIEGDLTDLNKSIDRLSNCVEHHPNGGKQFHVCEY